MGSTDFLTQTLEFSHIDGMGPSDAAEAFCEHHIGTTVHHLVGLKGAMVSRHGAAQEIIAHFSHSDIQMLANGAFVHWAID
jgi:hypothetical protein